MRTKEEIAAIKDLFESIAVAIVYVLAIVAILIVIPVACAWMLSNVLILLA